MLWYEAKLFAAHASGVSMDALHVLAGTLLQLVGAGLLNTTLKGWRPWLLVFAIELLNEGLDLWVERWPHPGMQIGEGAKDVLLTMALPTLLLVAARWWPRLFREATPAESAFRPGSPAESSGK